MEETPTSTLLCTLSFPLTGHMYTPTDIQLRSEPSPLHATLDRDVPFHHAPNDRLVVIRIRMDWAEAIEDSLDIFVMLSDLQNLARQAEKMGYSDKTVPWTEWGKDMARIYLGMYSDWSRYVAGTRFIGTTGRARIGYEELQVLDFNQISARRAYRDARGMEKTQFSMESDAYIVNEEIRVESSLPFRRSELLIQANNFTTVAMISLDGIVLLDVSSTNSIFTSL
jgi:hypothetical protein